MSFSFLFQFPVLYHLPGLELSLVSPLKDPQVFVLLARLPVHAQHHPQHSSLFQFASAQLLVSDHSGPVPFLCFRRSAFSSSFVPLFLF
uniref:Uncharacterized protein n=1 Tax=Nothobranchius pienaari TaxID=704102 RepID=A0A1A8L8Y1_9TELE